MNPIEITARQRAMVRANQIARKRNGKFKINQKEFLEEMEIMWISAEMSATERILQWLEANTWINTNDLMKGECHLLILTIFKTLKTRMKLKMDLSLEDFVSGRYSDKNNVSPDMKNGNNSRVQEHMSGETR